MRATRPPRPFALLLQRDRVALIEAEHGLVIAAAPLAAPLAASRGKGWVFDLPAAQMPGTLEMFASPQFPLAAYFAWFLERVYPVRKQRLTLVSNGWQPLSLSLWQHLFESIGLREPLQLRTPLHCLGVKLINGLLIHLEDGLARIGVFDHRRMLETAQVGYGFYLSRAIRQHMLARYGLQIDAATAEQAWQRLERQLTLEGRDSQGKRQRQLLTSEELDRVFAAAVAPLVGEIAHLERLYPELQPQLLGPQTALPWLTAQLARELPGPALLPADPEGILIQGIQQELRGQL